MPKIVHKCHSSDGLKYSHAYDEFGTYLSIESAVNISQRKWYLYPESQVELTLAAINSNGQRTHWRVKQNQIVTINGKSYEYTQEHDTESYEHKLAKGRIIEQSCCYYKGYKVLLSNAKEEVRVLDNRFRCDVFAALMDGTPCAIEIIKTSDISKEKNIALNESQLLTFKIYIDEKGNQIVSRDCITGNSEIKHITERIRQGEGKIQELREQIRELETNYERKPFY